jgi:hypothetical protein
MPVHRFHCLASTTVIGPGTAEDTPALAFDEDLAFGVLIRANNCPFGVIGTGVPDTV